MLKEGLWWVKHCGWQSVQCIHATWRNNEITAYHEVNKFPFQERQGFIVRNQPGLGLLAETGVGEEEVKDGHPLCENKRGEGRRDWSTFAALLIDSVTHTEGRNLVSERVKCNEMACVHVAWIAGMAMACLWWNGSVGRWLHSGWMGSSRFYWSVCGLDAFSWRLVRGVL